MKDNFQILSEAEHILKRPQMYIGSVTKEPSTEIIEFRQQTLEYVPALIKIINEIIDNSIDEGIRTNFKHSNKIEISVTDISVAVSDNGRGIPVVLKDGEYQPVLAWTRARAGTNFEDTDRVTLGMNGVGSFATNVMSKVFVGESRDGKHKLTLRCSEHGHVDDVSVKKCSTGKGVKVYFEPDLKLFGLDKIDDVHKLVIKDRLAHLSAIYPKIKFYFNGELVRYTTKDIAKEFGEPHVIYKGDEYTIILCGSDDEGFRQLSYINGLKCSNGGTHINYLMYEITSRLRELIKKKHKIDVTTNSIRNHFQLVVYMNEFPNAAFDSQTKERLTNTTGELTSYFNDIDFDAIVQKIFRTEDLIQPIIETQLLKKEIEEKRKAAKKQKEANRKKIPAHLPANSKNPEERILFLTEGRSAIASLTNVRDTNKHGGFPLKGKPKNVYGAKPMDILKNEEMFNIMTIVGLKIEEEPKDLLYGKIVIMADADVDGLNITALLLNFFSLWPQLFKEKRIGILRSPIVIAKKGGKVKRFYSLDDYLKESQNLEGWSIEYNKGLGSLSEEEYERMIHDPVIEWVEYDENAPDALELVFGDDADRRKKWLLENDN